MTNRSQSCKDRGNIALQVEGTASAGTLTWAKHGASWEEKEDQDAWALWCQKRSDGCRLRSRKVPAAQPRKGSEFCSKHDGNLWRVSGK